MLLFVIGNNEVIYMVSTHICCYYGSNTYFSTPYRGKLQYQIGVWFLQKLIWTNCDITYKLKHKYHWWWTVGKGLKFFHPSVLTDTPVKISCTLWDNYTGEINVFSFHIFLSWEIPWLFQCFWHVPWLFSKSQKDKSLYDLALRT